MRKPTDSSGIDNMTLYIVLYQIKEGDTFGNEIDQDEVPEDGSE